MINVFAMKTTQATKFINQKKYLFIFYILKFPAVE